jgi:site-specific recombinase
MTNVTDREVNAFKFYVAGGVCFVMAFCGLVLTTILFGPTFEEKDVFAVTLLFAVIAMFWLMVDIIATWVTRHSVGCVNPNEFKE